MTMSPLQPVGGALFYLPPIVIPGITTADALDANDQMGSVLQIVVPKRGCITKALIFDPSDQGISAEMWLFRQVPVLAASDSAFALADADLLNVIDVLTFATYKDAVNGQVALTADTPCWYTAEGVSIWVAFKTLGTPTYTAGSMPQLSLLIERYSNDQG